MVDGVKVIFAAEVCESALLSELYRLVLDENGEGRAGGLFRMYLVGGKLLCVEFGRGQVKFEYLGKDCDQVCLLLQAG